ncbi:MAG: hypothetical protein AB7O97_00430 [Planctomycetota bacterium]
MTPPLRTALLFPGLNGVARGARLADYAALPGFRARWQLVAAALPAAPALVAAGVGSEPGAASTDPVAALLQDARLAALAIAAMQLACVEALGADRLDAHWVTGYSVGDLARTIHAGAARFEDAVAFARELRARPGPGGETWYATRRGRGVDREAMRRRLLDAGLAVSLLSERAFLFSGPVDAVRGARQAAIGDGWHLHPITACALHGPSQREFAARLHAALVDAPLRPPRRPLWSSLRQRKLEDPDELRTELADNVAASCDLAATIRRLHLEHGVRHFVDVGPGRHGLHFVRHSGLPVTAESAIDRVRVDRLRVDRFGGPGR